MIGVSVRRRRERQGERKQEYKRGEETRSKEM